MRNCGPGGARVYRTPGCLIWSSELTTSVAAVDTHVMCMAMTTSRSPLPILVILALAASALIGCGSSHSATRDISVASYLRNADAVCEKANRSARRDKQHPKSFAALSVSVLDTRTTLEAATKRLHRLRSQLEGGAPERIDRFDQALGPYLQSMDRLEQPTIREERVRAAARLRRRGAALFAAAQAAGLRQCGRGGNAIADRAVFLDYRDDFYRIDDRQSQRVQSFARQHPNRSVGLTRQEFRRVTRIFREQLDATGRLMPPRKLRHLHQAYRRILRRALKTRELVQQTTSVEQGQPLLSRFGREFSIYQRLDRRLRRSLGQ